MDPQWQCSLLLSVTWLTIYSLCVSAKDQVLYCSACQILVSELEHSIRTTDPKQTVQVGSFRVDPQGKQKLSEVTYARSELHMAELVEEICSTVDTKYGREKTLSSAEIPLFVRILDGGGENLERMVDKSEGAHLKFACESILEEHEDELIERFRDQKAPTENIKKEFCIKTAGLCSPEDLYSINARSHALLKRANEVGELIKKSEARDKAKNQSESSDGDDTEREEEKTDENEGSDVYSSDAEVERTEKDEL